MQSFNWDDLQRSARNLEIEIDGQLVSLSRITSNLGDHFDNKDSKYNLESSYRQVSHDIEHLISKLGTVNDNLSQCLDLQGSTTPRSGTNYHTLQRHQEILKDYVEELKRICKNYQTYKDREELLGSMHNEISQFSPSSKESLLHQERNSLVNSENLINSQLDLASEARSSLADQGGQLRGVQSKVLAMSSRFPLLNSLINRINLRRQRDAVVVAVLIGVCLCIIIFYLMR